MYLRSISQRLNTAIRFLHNYCSKHDCNERCLLYCEKYPGECLLKGEPQKWKVTRKSYTEE